MEKHHFKQAKIWLDCARYCVNSPTEDSEKHNVAIACSIHAIIKANDGLGTRFFHRTARHHDEARTLFEQMIKENKVPPVYASYKSIIQEAITQKAKAEYRAAFFSKADAEDLMRKAEKFLAMVGKIIT